MYKSLEIKFFLLTLSFIFLASSACAFNEFQAFIEQKSKKQLNCAYCHNHSNGPEGNEIGQLGSLTEEEKMQTAYNQYLSANKKLIKSPILNDFGNYLVKKLGYEKIVQAQEDPEIFIQSLKQFDLDKDGISDSNELLDGTLANDLLDGLPHKLFVNNIKKKWLEICFQIFTIILLIVSLLKLKT